MKILITGVSGFIGNHLYNFLQRSHEVYGLARNANGKKNCFDLDLLDKEGVKTFFSKHNFDVVVHLATIVAKQDNLLDTAVLEQNLKITINLAEALTLHPPLQLINFSSASVYPNTTGTYSESSPIDPSLNTDCLYALSKFNAEMIFNCLLGKRTAVLNLRVPMVHGEGMDPTRIHTMFKKELKESNSITVFGEGKRVISQIGVEELCRKVSTLIEKKLQGTYNLAGEHLSLLDLAGRLIRDDGNSDSKIVTVTAGSRSEFVLDGSKLETILQS